MRLTVLSLMTALLASPAYAYDPFLDWQTLSTEHFNIHFAPKQRELASTTARLAERVHRELAPQLDWQPAEPTEIVLADDSDFANGSATPLPFNQIDLIVSPPEAGAFLEITDETDWLYQVLRHEYVHILQLDAATGAPAGLRRTFGRNLFSFPALFQPTWVIEGLATDLESDANRHTGRGDNSHMAMSMRAELLSGVKSLNAVSLGANLHRWPAGTAPYLYGMHFFQFLRARYGEDAAQRLLQEYRSHIMPFRIHKNARLTTGKPDMDALWAEFQQWLNARYQPQLAAIREAGVIEGEALTHGGQLDGSSSLQALPDDSVYYIRSDETRPTALIHRQANGQETTVSPVHALARFDVHPTAGIVLAQPEIHDNEQIYFDLYHIDPHSGQIQRLTQGARYRQVAWLPDGQGLLALKIDNGQSRIEQLRADGQLERTVWTAGEQEKASQLTVSPDGQQLVFVRSQAGAGADLVQLTLANGQLTVLTHDRNSEIYPRYSADGQALLYSSDHGGVSNLRRLELATGKITTLSNTLTGAFTPSQGRVNGPIWYARYTSEGYDLNRLDTPASLPLPAALPADPAPIVVDKTQPLPEPRPYSAWNTLQPRSWWPMLQADEIQTLLGASISGNDALGQHAYQLNIARDFRHDNWSGSFSYIWWQRLVLSLSRSQSFDTTGKGSDEKVLRIRNTDEAQLGLIWPWRRFAQRWNFASGLVWEKERDDWRDGFAAPEADKTDGVAGLALSVDSTQSVRQAPGATAGRQVQLLWETSDALGHSDYQGQTTALDWREFVDLPAAQVLALRLNAAHGDTGIRPYRLGGSFNEAPLLGNLPFNRRDINLRSYADGLLRGHGYQLASLEWRSPLWTVDYTFTSPPIGLSRLSGSLFSEHARVLNQDWGPWYHGIGAELIGTAVLGYWLPLDVRLGVAHGFDQKDGGTRGYLSVGYGF